MMHPLALELVGRRLRVRSAEACPNVPNMPACSQARLPLRAPGGPPVHCHPTGVQTETAVDGWSSQRGLERQAGVHLKEPD